MNEQGHSDLFPAEGPPLEQAKDGGNNSESTETSPQLHSRLFHIMTQLESMQAELDQLIDMAKSSGIRVDALTRHLTNPDVDRPVEEHLAELLARMETHQDQLDEMLTTTKKLARTQFKSNTLAETKEQQIASALVTLQEIAMQREELRQAQQGREQGRLSQIREQTWGELTLELLPLLDGVELALDSGRLLLERRRYHRQIARQAQEPPQPADQGMLQRTWQHLRRSLGADVIPPPATAFVAGMEEDAQVEESLEGWLEGLTLVHERFLAILANEGIEVISALGQSFNPKLHVALSTVIRSDVPTGTVVEVLRKGYRQRGRILRYAEVVVAKSDA